MGNYFAAFLLPDAQGFTHQNIDFRDFKPRGYILKTKFALRVKKKKDFFSKIIKKKPDRIIEERIIEERIIEERIIEERTIEEWTIEEWTIEERTIEERTIEERTIEERTIKEAL